MDLGSMFFVLAIALAVGLFVSQPLLTDERNTNIDKDGSAASSDKMLRAQLQADLDRGLNAMQELDSDHALGKLPEDDYSQQRSELAQAGANVLRRLDVLGPDPDETAADQTQAQKSPAIASKSPIERDEVEALIAARRRARQAKISGYCPQCGKPLTPSDQFCPRCGKPVNNKG
jgi:rubrerythrin